ncbi:unnamed protein product [Effrenium voratum]|uniref:Pentatricopeptide repeat-containing protein, chloroplastic n=1 Tax=Effrenium voratum TaxID=2562239 RepID=A0AA36IX40_9DINO|nr:unnamed protein product [Effrenium voratum]
MSMEAPDSQSAWTFARSRAATQLLSSLARKDAEQAEQVLRSLDTQNTEANAFHFSSVMSGYEKSCRWRSALRVAERMQQLQVPPDAACRHVQLGALARGAHWRRSVAEHLPTQRGSNALLLALERAKPELAMGVLREMPEWQVSPNQNSFSSCLRAVGRQRRWHQALDLLQEMQASALLVSLVALSCACAALESWAWALRLAEGNCLDAMAVCDILGTFQEQNLWQGACAFLRQMSASEVQTDAYALNAAASCALSAWQEAMAMSSQPDEVGAGALARACGESGNWEASFQLLQSLGWRRLAATQITLNAATSAAQQGSQWRWALLRDLSAVDARNAACGACGAGGAWRSALHLCRGAGPPGCGAALAACARAGRWCQAQRLLGAVADGTAWAQLATHAGAGGLE